MAEVKGAVHSDECEKADGGVCLCACGGTRHGIRLRTGKLRKMGDVKVTKARIGGKEAARVVDRSTGRPPGGGTKKERARPPEKPATAPANGARGAGSAPTSKPVTSLKEGDRVKVAGTDQYGRRISGEGYVQGASRVNIKRRGKLVGEKQAVQLAEYPDGAAGWRMTVYVDRDASAELAPAPKRPAARPPETPAAAPVAAAPSARPDIADGMNGRMFTRAQRDLLARVAAGEQVDKHPSRAALLKMRALLPDGTGVKVNPALIDLPETPISERPTPRPNVAPEATRELRGVADTLAKSVPGRRPIVGDKSAHDIVRELHDDVRSGRVTPERAAERLDQIATNLFSDVGFDLVDAARRIRGDKLSPPRPDQHGTMRDAGWLDAAELRPVKERTGGWAVHSRPSAKHPHGTSYHVATKAEALEWIADAAKTRRFWVGEGPNPGTSRPAARPAAAARAADVQVRTNTPPVSDEWQDIVKRVSADFGLVDHDKAKNAARREARAAHGLPTIAEASKLTKTRGMSDQAEADRERGEAAQAVYAAAEKLAGLKAGYDNNRRQIEAAQREINRGGIRPANAAKLQASIDRISAGEGAHRDRIAAADQDLAVKVGEWQAGPEGRAAMRAQRERIAAEEFAAAEAARWERVKREVQQRREAEEDVALTSLEEARRKVGDLDLRTPEDARALAARVGLEAFNVFTDGRGGFSAAFQNARGDRVANYDSGRGWGDPTGAGRLNADQVALTLGSDARHADYWDRVHQVGEVLKKAEKARERKHPTPPAPPKAAPPAGGAQATRTRPATAPARKPPAAAGAGSRPARATELAIDGTERTFVPADRSTIGVAARPEVGRRKPADTQLGLFADDKKEIAGQGALLDALNQIPAPPPAGPRRRTVVKTARGWAVVDGDGKTVAVYRTKDAAEHEREQLRKRDKTVTR